jgi:hypothetical protein
MSQRRIGQEAFAFGSSGDGRRSSLDDLRDLIDWAPIERQLAVVSCSAKANRRGRCWRCSRPCCLRCGTICRT